MKPRILIAFLLGLSVAQVGISGAHAASATASKPAAKKTAVKKAVVKPAPKKAVAKNTTATARKVSIKRTPVAPAADEGELTLDAHGNPQLRSSAFYVLNEATGNVLLERNSASIVPIASITKLMTAMVVLEAGQSLSEELVISEADIDTLKGTGSRLALGTRLTREEMLNLALMSSENRAASALARHYPGGMPAFVEAMNVKARLLGMWDTRFHDSTGLTPANVSSPRDLAKMVEAASSYPLIREFSTTSERYVDIKGRSLRFGNTNGLVRSPDWEIAVSKTGYINEAGRCLVMKAWMHKQPVVIVLMDSVGRYTRTADAQRVRKWLEAAGGERFVVAAGGHSS
ncbi:D-alanyl-D-alanine endopeptidase [Azoarcus indigens]|uniref:Murein-DD-endopeptidase n=1 Tax=Azoarcus indigens TaxID=29545 RepID=A0A4R6E5V3_9RHOO|nr:D-alanyl-D-alanine endopeptidase [Azoarcus indigens]NMG64510.1 D-alanyl-D-alanine endopeptidase [Azoarcus indigens]TDN52338.1 murein-DD-endopeptidase [Azoarcus indigens]